MAVKKSFEEWVGDARAVHGDKYAYLYLLKKNNRVCLKIECPEHGVFEQYPSNHIQREVGCSKCAGNYKLSIQDLVSKGDSKYQYFGTIIKNNRTYVIFKCPDHGMIMQLQRNHLDRKDGCKSCGSINRAKSLSDRIKEARAVHGYRYEYLGLYTKDRFSYLTVDCSEHGIFDQKARDHILGHGCPNCADCSFSTTKPALFYIIKVGDLYKIGVTNRSVYKRYEDEGIEYKVVYSENLSTGREALDIENAVKTLFNLYKYTGKSPFSKTGTTELFTINPLSVILAYSMYLNFLISRTGDK